MVVQLFGPVASAQDGGVSMASAQDVIRKMELVPLPDEGGFYRETFRSSGRKIDAKTFGIKSDAQRTISTAIYYLIVPKSFSALHRLQSDEIFHFYGGDPVEMIQIDPDGNLRRLTLGPDIFRGQTPQIVVPRGTWQALRLINGGAWALMGTTVAPGFEFEDFELGNREKLIEQFPQHRDDIISFSRGQNEKAQ